MAVRTLGLESGVTSLEDHRHGLSTFVTQAGVLTGRSGLVPTAGAADLTTVSAMVGQVEPFSAWVDGTSNIMQAGYDVVSDTAWQFTVPDGEAQVDRLDRIGVQVQHNAYDGSGVTVAGPVYIAGQATGQATAWPPSTLELYEFTVPAGTQVSTGGIDFATATDLRRYTTAAGGVVPIRSRTERDAVQAPYAGMLIYRLDWGWIEIYDGGAWRVQGTATASSLATLITGVTDPYQGQVAVTRDTNRLHIHDGTAWVALAATSLVTQVRQSHQQDLPDSTDVAMDWDITDRSDVGGFSGSVVTLTRAGQFHADAMVPFWVNSNGSRIVRINKNGVTVPSSTRYRPPTVGHTTEIDTIANFEGAVDDEIELIAQQDSGGDGHTGSGSAEIDAVLTLTYQGPA